MSTPVAAPAKICSFCGKDRPQVAQMIGGPVWDIAICNECIVLCNEILEETTQGAAQPVNVPPHCVICGKGQSAVHQLISGQSAAGICSDCIDTCHDLIHRQPPEIPPVEDLPH